MKKKRVEWNVGLYPYNLGERGETLPRVQLKGTRDMDQVIDRIIADRSELRRETLQTVVSMLVDKIEDMLIEGYAISTPLGTLTPSVEGLWNYNRILPEARAQNRATVNYTMSKRLKELFANPLFHEEQRPTTGPRIYHIFDMGAGTRDATLTAGRNFLIEGALLLMNGDAPERGVYLVEEETGQTACFIPATEFASYINTRSQLWGKLPADVAPGRYRLRVASQCTTSPRPLKQVAYGEWYKAVEVLADTAAG